VDQYQLLKINVRNSHPVDLLTPGFQFEAIERNVFRCSQMGRLRSSVLSRREINSDSRESKKRCVPSRGDGRGCDADALRRDTRQGVKEYSRETRDIVRGKKESSSCFREKCRCTSRRGRNIRATGERQVSSTSFISQRLVLSRQRKILLSSYPAKTARRTSQID